MKKFIQNQYVIAGGIILIALGVGYAFTWGNKQWLLDQLAAKNYVTDEMLKTYATKSTSELRSILKAKQST